MTVLALTDEAPDRIKSDAIVIGVQPDGEGAALPVGHGLPRKTAEHLAAVLTAIGATGKVDDVHSVALVPGLQAEKVVLAGLAPAAGKSVVVTPMSIRQGVGSALRHLGKTGTVVVRVPASGVEQVAAAAEGALLGAYAYTVHKSVKDADAKRAKDRSFGTRTQGGSELTARRILIAVLDAGNPAARAAIQRAEILGAATAYARDLVNTPPNFLYPEAFVTSVTEQIAATRAKIQVVVHDEQALADLGCGGIVGVGQGSARPPRIMELHYAPRRKAVAHVAFVGKGITFDTGGICIKPPASMLTMKCDMAGAGAVAAAVLAAAQLKLPVAVSGYLCLAENMPGGGAQRPSDIVTMRNRMTVEIIDTDAEGRMVLGDGLALASERGPDAILDVATLTGACMIALGATVGGVMSNDEQVSADVLSSSESAGEPMWRLPLPEELRPKLDSPTADMQHKGDQYGGALTAGLFLREFVKDGDGEPIPWAHLDIAGPAFNSAGPWGHTPKGATGFAVSTLVRFAEQRGGR